MMKSLSRVVSLRLVVLAAPCLALAWLFYSALNEPTGPPAFLVPPSEARAPMAIPAVEAYMPPAIETYAEFVRRPLFARSRRPPPMVVEERPRTERLTLSLVGTIITGETPYALIDPGNGQPILHLGEGEAAAGWTITRIQSHAVVLNRGGEERKLHMYYDAVEPPRPVIARERVRQPPETDDDPADNTDS